MYVYRITTSKWANSLSGSGYSARWNSKGIYVVYTSSNPSLATLENIVHRSGEGFNHLFKLVEIEVPQTIKIHCIEKRRLPQDWDTYENYSICQKIGDAWVKENTTAVLQVPSVIIKSEYNYILNPNHPSFSKIKISKIRDFEFDSRLKR